MSDMSAKVEETKNGFHVEGYEKIEYDFSFTENIFDKNNDGLAKQFTRLNRCLAVMDTNIFNVYGQQLKNYFDHYNIELKVHKTMIGEKAKSIETLLSIVDSMTEFGKRICSPLSRTLADNCSRHHPQGTCARRWRWPGHRCYWVVLRFHRKR